MPTSVLTGQEPQVIPGQTVAKEGPAQQQDQGLGPNNERLKEMYPRCVAAMRMMIEEYRTEAVVARRHEIRRIRQARYFWQGIQNLFWDPTRGDWNLPSLVGQKGPQDQGTDETPRYQYVQNIFQAYGLAFISVMSQDVPTVRFWPQSVNRSDDLTAAKAASDAAELIEQNNKVQELLSSLAYFLWTDGKVGGYVRYVVDGQRFGFKPQDDLQQVTKPIGEDAYNCPQCGAQTPMSSNLQSQVSEDGGQVIYQQCGTAMTNDNFKPA